jgi:Ca2+-binding RTX toxin-like protein
MQPVRRATLLLATVALTVTGCASSDPKAAPTNPAPTNNVINGTNHADHLTGTPGNDTINGLDGTDVISGLGGDDVINGGELGGTGDTLNGGPGDDLIRLVNVGRVYAGPGDDTVRAVYLFSRSTIDCGPGDDHVYLTDQTRQNVRITSCEKITTTPIN